MKQHVNLFARLASGVAIFALSSATGFAATSAVVYAWEDSFTQGSWVGSYGPNGFVIANGPAQNPAFGTFSVTGSMNYTWAAQTADPRALVSDPQDHPTLTRIAAAFNQYQSKSFSMNYTSVDGIPEIVSLYLLDWDTNNTRSEVVTMTDASTGALLDQRTFSNFHNGKYEVYAMVGNVKITVTPVGGSSPVVSGVFFGLGVTVPQIYTGNSGAIYRGTDTFTGGNWQGAYGANGYLIANSIFKAPTYATVSVTNAMGYTWAGQTTDPRALLVATTPQAVRIASEFYQYQSKPFSINVNVNDGGIHRIALYLLDWDTTSRVETVTITDLSTGFLLDQRTFSGFHNGEYALWDVKGNVVITVTPSDSTTATVSGIFFN